MGPPNCSFSFNLSLQHFLHQQWHPSPLTSPHPPLARPLLQAARLLLPRLLVLRRPQLRSLPSLLARAARRRSATDPERRPTLPTSTRSSRRSTLTLVSPTRPCLSSTLSSTTFSSVSPVKPPSSLPTTRSLLSLLVRSRLPSVSSCP